jgi:hypothetical protein
MKRIAFAALWIVWIATTASSDPAHAAQYLAKVMDQFHESYDVYTTVDAAGNHFAVRARMSNYDNTCRPEDAARAVPPMDERWTKDCRSAPTCIRLSFRPEVRQGEFNWGAWYFMNGVQHDPDLLREPPYERCPNVVPSVRRTRAFPVPNWGDQPNAGIDLRGAMRVSFWAKGERGDELIEFFALGVGWNPDRLDVHGRAIPASDPKTDDDIFRYRDSSRRVPPLLPERRIHPLTQEWQRYTIELNGQDLSYVLGGFGWAAKSSANFGKNEIVFYLDDIRYELDPAAQRRRLDEPRFLVSFQTGAERPFDRVMRNAAYTYDNALALMAFLAVGDQRRAGLIADAFVKVQESDRFRSTNPQFMRVYNDAIRNAYQGGDLTSPPGWIAGGRTGTARLPGWYQNQDGTAALLPSDLPNPSRFACLLLHSRDELPAAIRARAAPSVLETIERGAECGQVDAADPRQMLSAELNRIAPAAELRALRAAFPDEIVRVQDEWLEDSYSASLDAGNTAWAMLALLAYHEAIGAQPGSRYLAAAVKLGNWVVRHCDYDGIGYTGGFNGFEPDGELKRLPKFAYYKSTEHNIDLYAAFEHLYLLTGDEIWRLRALRALDFILSMWNDRDGMFWTGTNLAGEPNKTVIPLDIQPWAVLALRDALPDERQRHALEYADRYLQMPGGGYDYSRRACSTAGTGCCDHQGTWYEGTAQMAAAYRARGNAAKADEILRFLNAAQDRDSGAMKSSDQDQGLVTGFVHADECIRYFHQSHVGATAWLILAETGANPYWMRK